jgi:hypothetical protein
MNLDQMVLEWSPTPCLGCGEPLFRHYSSLGKDTSQNNPAWRSMINGDTCPDDQVFNGPHVPAEPIPSEDEIQERLFEIREQLDEILADTRKCSHWMTHDTRQVELPIGHQAWVRTCSLCGEDIWGEDLL